MTALALWPDGFVASSILLVVLVVILVWRGIRIHLTIKKDRDHE